MKKKHSTLDAIRKEAYKHKHPFWSQYLALRKDIRMGNVKVPFAMQISRKAFVGNMLIAAILELIDYQDRYKALTDQYKALQTDYEEIGGKITRMGQTGKIELYLRQMLRQEDRAFMQLLYFKCMRCNKLKPLSLAVLEVENPSIVPEYGTDSVRATSITIKQWKELVCMDCTRWQNGGRI